MSDVSPAQTGADNVMDFSDDLTAPREMGGGWPAAILLALAVFVAIAPTLSWLEFSSSMENLVAATSLEIRRTGNWLLPTLEGEPRVVKPPLATWISAASIRPSTFREIDSPNELERRAAYRDLAFEIRWPGLAASCLMLLAIFDLGKTIAGLRCGIYSMCIAASTFYFFRYGRQATTDVHLALWTTVTTAALARIVLRGTTWRAVLVAAIACGLAFMSKGPVVVLQSVLPAMIFAIWREPNWRRWKLKAFIVAAAIAIVIGAAWFAIVLVRVPSAPHLWSLDLTRGGREQHALHPLSYGTILGYMMPWSVLFVHGLVWSGIDTIEVARNRASWLGRAGWILMFLTIAIPVVVMSFVPDPEERYMLPLLGPFAAIAARSLTVTLDRLPGPKIPAAVQWFILLVVASGLPAAGATFLKRIDGQPWYSQRFAIQAGAVLVGVVVIGMLFALRRRGALLGATLVLMLILQPIFYIGYRDSRQGRSEMRPLAELVRDEYPDAQVYNWRPDSNKRASVDFSIYLNRSTLWAPDPTKLPTANQPQICLRLQNKREPEPTAPPGWSRIAKVPRDADWYLAFVRENESAHDFAAPATRQ